MASIFKPNGSSKYVIEYTDETGRRRKKIGATDKAVTERIARDIENKVALRREGIIDPREEAYAKHAALPLLTHLDAWGESLSSKGVTRQHLKLHTSRAMRVVALFLERSFPTSSRRSRQRDKASQERPPSCGSGFLPPDCPT